MAEPVILSSDPAQMMGEKSNDPFGAIFNAPPEDGADGMPDHIHEAFEEFGLDEKSYQAILKRVGDESGNGVTASYVKTFTNQYPSIEFIAKEYGPGMYILTFNWRVWKDGKHRRETTKADITIGHEYQDVYDENQIRKQIRAAEKRNDLMRAARLRKVLSMDLKELEDGNTQKERKDPVQAGKDYVKQIVEDATMLGLTKPQGGGLGEVLKEFAPMMVPIIQLMSQRAQAEREQSQNMLMMMLQMQQKSTEQMMQAMTSIHKPQTGSDHIKDITDMIFNVVDLKKAINPPEEKESVLDKVFGLLENTAPLIMQMSQMSQKQRAVNPMYQFAKQQVESNPDIQKVLSDDTMLCEMVHRIDSYYGWEQADGILQVMGKERPANCPRTEKTRFPAGDPRNAQQAENAIQQAESVRESEEENGTGSQSTRHDDPGTT